MPLTQVKGMRRQRWLRKVLLRVMCLMAVGTCLAWGISRSASADSRNHHVAGFGRGVLHGALMPLALPNLLLGSDVTIYASNNTGRTYKLGYTLGVNGCGLLFFGFFFWRVNRWKKGARGEGKSQV